MLLKGHLRYNGIDFFLSRFSLLMVFVLHTQTHNHDSVGEERERIKSGKKRILRKCSNEEEKEEEEAKGTGRPK